MPNVFLHPLLKKRGLSLASWSARGLDGRDTDRVRIVRRVVDGVEPGAILLLHEGMRDAAGRSLAVDTVPAGACRDRPPRLPLRHSARLAPRPG